ncbi:MAG: hypothetical protein HC882_03600 [Acidobacteria bacterium]|nr:hypothetical protein [Acidobacteriota bacterium]
MNRNGRSNKRRACIGIPMLALAIAAMLLPAPALAESCWGCVNGSCIGGMASGGVLCREEVVTCSGWLQFFGFECSRKVCEPMGFCPRVVDQKPAQIEFDLDGDDDDRPGSGPGGLR